MTINLADFSPKHQIEILKGLESLRGKVVAELDDFRLGCLLDGDESFDDANQDFRNQYMEMMIGASYGGGYVEHSDVEVMDIITAAFVECFVKAAKSHNYTSFDLSIVFSDYYFGGGKTVDAFKEVIPGAYLKDNTEKTEATFCELAYANMRNVLDRINAMIVIIAATNKMIGNVNDSVLMRVMYNMREQCMQYVADTAIMAGGDCLTDYAKMMYDSRFTAQGEFEVPAVHFLVGEYVSHYTRGQKANRSDIMDDIRASALKYGHKLV
jgi:hypothetical protein